MDARTVLEMAKANPGKELVFEGQQKDELIALAVKLIPEADWPKMHAAKRIRLVPVGGGPTRSGWAFNFDWHFDS